MSTEPIDQLFEDASPATSQPARRSGRWLQRLTEPAVLFPILAVLTLGAVWLATLNVIRTERQVAEDAAYATSRELLDTYEAQVVRVLREIDQTLKSLQYGYHVRGDAQAALDDLRSRDLLPPELVFRVSLTDVDGAVLASNREPHSGSALDAAYVEHTRQSGAVADGRPVLLDGEWFLRFSRSLIRPDGSFGGVAVVDADASFFVSGYDPAKLGAHGFLAVLGHDGVFRVRRTGDRFLVGDSVTYAAVVTNQGFGETAPVLTVNSWDDVQRYTSGRELYDFPLAVAVGVSRTELFSPVARRARVYLLRAGGVSLLLAFGLALLGRLSWTLENLRRREREYRAAHAKRVEHLAYHDALTGLPNRSFMSKILDSRIRLASRYGRNFALLFLDLDGFKQINDTLGHDAGDDLLREVARRLEEALRKSDTVARMGGDEFMVLLPELESEQQAAVVAKKILNSLSQPFVLLGEKFTVTVSIGISIFPDDGEDEQTLMKNADIAMYAAKDAGKNNFRYFSAEMSSASQERINLESGLRRALACEEFELHYQARRDLTTGRVTGMEALLRWQHPEYGIIGPNKFLPLAEETGLIIPIGKWVLRAACRQSVQWQEQGLADASIAVNLSARQFFNPALAADIAAILRETSMPPHRLELEISESVLARDTRKTLPVLQRLKQLGVKITVDNFGTSYSALSALGQLPLDSIKVDRLFLREDSGNAAAREVINSVLAMGRVLSPIVVAHGVETREQVDFLRTRACGQVQGFYFGRPFSADDAPGILREEEFVLNG